MNQINNDNIAKEPDLYAMINELRNKYEILEKRQKDNEELSKKNMTNILNLNTSLIGLKKIVQKMKNEYIKQIEDLNKIVHDIIGQNEKDKINIIEINSIKNQYNEMSKELTKSFDSLNKEIKEIKIKIAINNNFNINKSIFKDKNENNKNNDININKNKNGELNIDKKEQKTVFDKFQNLLAMIIEKNEIDNKILEELKEVSEKLIINNISPLEYATEYFSDTYKYFVREKLNQKDVEKVLIINRKIFDVLEKIEPELKEKINNEKKPEKKIVDRRVEKFRINKQIKDEDATDKEILDLLNVHRNNEQKVYEILIENILKKNNK